MGVCFQPVGRPGAAHGRSSALRPMWERIQVAARCFGRLSRWFVEALGLPGSSLTQFTGAGQVEPIPSGFGVALGESRQ